MKVFVVTTVKKMIDHPVAVGVFTDRSKAEQAAVASLTEDDAILERIIKFRKEHNDKDPITKIQDGSSTMWVHIQERIDWHDRGGTIIAAQLIETFLTKD